ncbi:hypothetical protein YQE_03361, partial [Dendroctonus ponderosae]
SLPVPRRHTPYFGQPDYRIYELNRRLQQRTEESDNLWWDAFATEFFEDDSSLTLAFCLEDGPKRYTIGRTLIPRYFRSIFEGGVTELYYNLKHPKESFHNTSITLDCDQCTMVTNHGKPLFTKDVMVVGEPSLMGGEFGDEDERMITRLENSQYDAANSLDHDNHGGGGFHGADSPMAGSNSWGTGTNVKHV